MIVVMKSDATEAEILKVTDRLVQKGMQVQTNHGLDCTVLGVLGDTYTVDKERIGLMGGVERVVSVQEPFKKANRKFHPEDSVIDVDGIRIGAVSYTHLKRLPASRDCKIESADVRDTAKHQV